MYSLDEDGMIRFDEDREAEIRGRIGAFASQLTEDVRFGRCRTRDALMQMAGYMRGCMNSAMRAEFNIESGDAADL